SSHNNVSSKSNITDFNIILSSFIIYLIFLFLLYYGIYNLSLSLSFFILIEDSYFVINLSFLNLNGSILYVIFCYKFLFKIIFFFFFIYFLFFFLFYYCIYNLLLSSLFFILIEES